MKKTSKKEEVTQKIKERTLNEIVDPRIFFLVVFDKHTHTASMSLVYLAWQAACCASVPRLWRIVAHQTTHYFPSLATKSPGRQQYVVETSQNRRSHVLEPRPPCGSNRIVFSNAWRPPDRLHGRHVLPLISSSPRGPCLRQTADHRPSATTFAWWASPVINCVHRRLRGAPRPSGKTHRHACRAQGARTYERHVPTLACGAWTRVKDAREQAASPGSACLSVYYSCLVTLSVSLAGQCPLWFTCPYWETRRGPSTWRPSP